MHFERLLRRSFLYGPQDVGPRYGLSPLKGLLLRGNIVERGSVWCADLVPAGESAAMEIMGQSRVSCRESQSKILALVSTHLSLRTRT